MSSKTKSFLLTEDGVEYLVTKYYWGTTVFAYNVGPKTGLIGRMCGPAIFHPDGTKEYIINHNDLTKKQFLKVRTVLDLQINLV
jgi:hypothetical protein